MRSDTDNMTSDEINAAIAEYRRLGRLGKLTPMQADRWAAVGPHHQSCDDIDCSHSPDETCQDDASAKADAAGIVATHNAADMLLEVAEAALALVGPAQVSHAQRPEFNALILALAKVQP